ncbi:MAG: hypothetical protein JNL39_23100 [Opitutaceae bacterium]|nr:hypothetical protein [Opitutaceae bacterium]
MNTTTFPSLLRRLVAASGAALVLALSIFAASPQAHAWLHDAGHHGHAHHHDEAQGREDGCAVVLFAGGVALPVGPAAPLPPLSRSAIEPRRPAMEIFLVSPRYRFQPERGPPANRIS